MFEHTLKSWFQKHEVSEIRANLDEQHYKESMNEAKIGGFQRWELIVENPKIEWRERGS